jgi:hypothetical protein
MKIFHYHPKTGAFLSEGTADPSPLEPGKWLVPAYATATMPPAAQSGKQAVWVDSAWQLQPIPTPEPAPTPEQPEFEPPAILTPEQKLAAAGLTVAELRTLLGLD